VMLVTERDRLVDGVVLGRIGPDIDTVDDEYGGERSQRS